MTVANLTLVFGAPRSGTTWLAKILDSHPQVLYRHEPDISQPTDIPIVCGPEDFDRYVEPMRRFVQAMLATRSVKAAGSLPVFRKTFDSPLTFGARVGAVYSIRLLQKMLSRHRTRGLTVPEFGSPLTRPDIHPLIKSVTSLGRVGLMLKAVPTARAILIVRNPLGQVASRLDGLARGKFERGGGFDRRLLVSPQARQFGLTASVLDRLKLPEQLAWEWAVLNAMALETVRGLPQTRVVRYVDLLEQPMQHARELLAFAGLAWHPATEDFVDRSTRYQGPDLYYQVFRNIETQKEKWRDRIDLAAQRQILGVMQAAEMTQLWPELQD